ncbi:MAG: arginine repressor [Tissierellia bacterium]|nr:arginine repressor [Tissierellia bacterium]
MKKYTRQRIILDLIESVEIETQEELGDYLLKKGIDITQATISRDIKELRLVKVLTPKGKYKYAPMDSQHEGVNDRLVKIFRSSVLNVNKAEGIIVIKTLPGAAQVCASALDNFRMDGIAGTIAGDDTIFVAISHRDIVDTAFKTIQSLLK